MYPSQHYVRYNIGVHIGGDMASTWVVKPMVHVEEQIPSLI